MRTMCVGRGARDDIELGKGRTGMNRKRTTVTAEVHRDAQSGRT